jgi:predicted HTH domain antitoxin
MKLTLPDDIPALRNMTESELRRELALSLYAARKITVVQAADVAGLSLFELQALLRDRRIPQHYDESELDKDLHVLRELGSR